MVIKNKMLKQPQYNKIKAYLIKKQAIQAKENENKFCEMGKIKILIAFINRQKQIIGKCL